MPKLSQGERLAALAGLSAAVAALLGFIPGVYRDSAALIVQSHGQDAATLVLGIPVLALGLWASVRGSLRGRLIVEGVLGYLLYAYVVYAFDAVLNPVTVLYIAVVGCASWSFIASASNPSQVDVESTLGHGLPRRTTGVFLLLIALIFGLLWLSQMAAAGLTGVRPQALVDAGWPNSPIYVLDLAFVLPLCVVTGVRLLTGRAALRIAIPLLVFTPLLSAGVLSITAFAALAGQPLDVLQGAVFVVVTTVGVVLAWLGLRRRPYLRNHARTHRVSVTLGGLHSR